MKDLDKHIAELDQLLKGKGYDGFFLSAGGHSGRLTASLGSFCASIFNGGEYGFTFPPTLTTYGYWGGVQSESVECRFKLDHREKEGFSIKSMELESRDRYGFRDKQKTITVLSEADIPTRQQARSWALEPEIKMVSNKSKGLKM